MFSELFCQCLKYLIPGADDFIPNTFDGLPYDVVGTIFGKLPIGDRARMRLVSKSWRDRLVRSDFPVKPEPPWLILPIDSYDQSEQLSTEMSFESMSEERIYRFELPVCSSSSGGGGGRYRWCCCGSSSDGGSWLLMAGRKAGDDLSSTKMILWDPISGTTKGLPALSSLPFFGELMGHCEYVGLDNISTSEVIARAQVFSVGSCLVVAVVFVTNLDRVIKTRRLALCSPEDQSWSVVPDGPGYDHYNDILFQNGKLYTVTPKIRATSNSSVATGLKLSGPEARRTRDCMVRLSCCCDVEVIMLDLMYDDQGEDDDDHAGSRKLVERWNVVEHLVGSSSTTGELLVVSAILDNYLYDSGGRGPFASHTCYQTRGFEVYGLDVNDVNGLCCLERLRNVGKQCIFVGATGSTSVESGVDCNNIQFATNNAGGGHWINEEQYDDEHDHIEEEEEEEDEVECDLDELFVVHEQGVFDVPRDKIEKTYWTNLSKQSGSCIGWFTPKLPT